jgi:hypothetical protein
VLSPVPLLLDQLGRPDHRVRRPREVVALTAR